MLNIGIIGAGTWGINHVRTFNSIKDCRVLKVADLDAVNRQKIQEINSLTVSTANYHEILDDNAIEAVVIATPSGLHYRIAKEALLRGKHVLVEKPLCFEPAQAEELVKIAEENKLVLMVGHLMLFHPAVTWIKNYIAAGEIGKIHYIYTQRLNFGKIRTEENVLWSLAPHDISLMLYFMGDKELVDTGGFGRSFINKGVEDVYFFNLVFEDGTFGNGHVSWLDPNKTRKLTIVGSKKMIVFDDMAPLEKVKVFDKGVAEKEYNSYGEAMTVRDGDIYTPYIKIEEPLKKEGEHFINCIRNKARPLSDGYNGLDTVRIINRILRC